MARTLVCGCWLLDAGQQPLGRVQRAVGIVVTERPAVCPVIAYVAQLAGVGLLHLAQVAVERVPPWFDLVGDVLGEHPQLKRWVQPVVLLAVDAVLGILESHEDGPVLALGHLCTEYLSDEGVQGRSEGVDHLADAVAVGECHVECSESQVWVLVRCRPM